MALPACAAQGRQTVEGQVCTSKHKEAAKHTHYGYMMAGHKRGRGDSETWGGGVAGRLIEQTTTFQVPSTAGTHKCTV